jgi:hypothetical protein
MPALPRQSALTGFRGVRWVLRLTSELSFNSPQFTCLVFLSWLEYVKRFHTAEARSIPDQASSRDTQSQVQKITAFED